MRPVLPVIAFLALPWMTPLSAQADPGTVKFQIAESPLSGGGRGTREWVASYASGSGVSKVIIRLDLGSVNPNETINWAKGTFVRVEGSKPGPLLQALKVALEAKKLPKGIKPLKALPFTCAVLGLHSSKGPMGGFSSNPPGDWIVTKVFLADGEAEVFLDLNPKEGVGEFSIKDEEYGDSVLASLASVL